MLSGPVIVAASALYLLLLFAVAYFGDKRADAGEGKRDGMRGHHGKRGGHHGMMMGKADTNGDKAISQAEFQTAALARFDAADANKDGQVTAEERQAQRGAWRAKRGAPPAAPAGE